MGEMILKKKHLDLCFSPCSFSSLSLLTSFTTANSVQCPLQQTGAAAIAQEHVCLQNKCGCVSRGKECVLRNQGESFLVPVPAIVPSP